MNQMLESDCKAGFFSFEEAEIQMANTYMLNTKCSLLQVSGIQLSFFLSIPLEYSYV